MLSPIDERRARAALQGLYSIAVETSQG